MQIHQSITEDRLIRAVEDSMYGTDNPGFCVKCGAEAEGCEPDARGYRCEECGAMSVYGAEEIRIVDEAGQ